MKIPFTSVRGVVGALAVACVFAAPPDASADHKPKYKKALKHVVKHVPPGHARRSYDDDHAFRTYSSFPRSRFAVTLGSGYAGRGYYYGPPGVPYYYRHPGVMFWPTRTAVPRTYWGGPPSTYQNQYVEMDVQRSLARMGYYHGSIDGAIGPRSRDAIARFQADNGLPVTGRIDSSLLRALGL